MPKYDFKTLPITNSPDSGARAINDAGEVVGFYEDPTSADHGFTYVDGVLTTLDIPGAQSTELVGINASGEIVGRYFSPGSGGGFTYQDGHFQEIIVPGSARTTPTAINDYGQIVGTYYDANSKLHGFLDDNGTITEVGNSAINNINITDINNTGDYVGAYYDTSGVEHGLLGSGGDITPIDVPGATFTTVADINNSGEITGFYSDASRVTKSFIMKNGVMTTFAAAGADGTIALGINDAGDVTGYYVDLANVVHGFTERDGVLTTIDDPEAGGIGFYSVNNRGQLAGFAIDNNTNSAVLASPTPPGITGSVAGQRTADEAPIAPFSGVTVADPSGGIDTLTIVLSGGGGTLVDGPGFTGPKTLAMTSAGTYTLKGSADALTAELDALRFTPKAPTAGGQATTTFTLSDTSDAVPGATATDAATTVIDTDTPAALAAPTLAPASDTGASSSDGITAATAPVFTGTALAGATVTLLVGSATVGTGTADAATGAYSIVASGLKQGFNAITATQTLGGLASPASPATGVTLDTTAPTVLSVSFAGAGIDGSGDGDLKAGAMLSITLAGSEPLTVTGTPSLTLNDGGTATYAGGAGTGKLVFTTTVMSGDASDALAVTGIGTGIADVAGNALGTGSLATATLPSGVIEIDTVAPTVGSTTLKVAQNSAPTAIGLALPSDAGTAALAIAVAMLPTDGTAVVSGQSLTAAQLTGLLFTPTTGAYSQGSSFVYTAADRAGNVSTGAATLTIGGPGVPTIKGTQGGQTTTAEAPVTPFAGVTIADPNGNATETLVITLNGGGGSLANGAGHAGLTSNGDGTYTLTGTAAEVTADLDALRFTPTNATPGGVASTRFTLDDASSAGTSASNSGTTVVDTAAPPPPAGTVSVDPDVTYDGHGGFVITGRVSSTAGVSGIDFSATVDGAAVDLGTATPNRDGSFVFRDAVGAATQSSIVATETGSGALAGTPAFFDLVAGLTGEPYVARQDSYDPTTGAFTGQTFFGRSGGVVYESAYRDEGDGTVSYTYSDGSYFDHRAIGSFTDRYRGDGTLLQETRNRDDGTTVAIAAAPGQSLVAVGHDVMDANGQDATRFVFTPGFVEARVLNFDASGPGHDVISLSRQDFAGIADILRHTRDAAGGAVITDATTGDTIKVVGVTKADLSQHRSDVALHA